MLLFDRLYALSLDRYGPRVMQVYQKESGADISAAQVCKYQFEFLQLACVFVQPQLQAQAVFQEYRKALYLVAVDLGNILGLREFRLRSEEIQQLYGFPDESGVLGKTGEDRQVRFLAAVELFDYRAFLINEK